MTAPSSSPPPSDPRIEKLEGAVMDSRLLAAKIAGGAAVLSVGLGLFFGLQLRDIPSKVDRIVSTKIDSIGEARVGAVIDSTLSRRKKRAIAAADTIDEMYARSLVKSLQIDTVVARLVRALADTSPRVAAVASASPLRTTFNGSGGCTRSGSLLICWGVSSLMAEKQAVQFKFSFGQAFQDAPTVVTGINGNNSGHIYGVFVHRVTASEFSGTALNPERTGEREAVVMNYLAIGRAGK